ncbi:hypothetical protein M3I54_37650 [Paraburkholderia sp. CNPSo 3274]|uniref:hypothetical protein n=1 Tax=Paraburkholderia sp. CNPSo 3274 TaxID=2940932 RepID=UPI0020B807F2|nr:hypothetical protein [Paraburkholderia sp. CNPSo 3274]MCP3712579.1 hypothetical protein [Paraburkholderia sp. CNPSo 3274]
MNPALKKTAIGAVTETAGSGVDGPSTFVFTISPIPKKINKPGPFKLSKITEEYPYFSHLLNLTVQEKVRELPDFSDDRNIAVMSDIGGEHDEARFVTYSFLFMAYDKVGPFEEKVKELRKKYGLLTPYSEFAYKKLKSGAKARALAEYLQIVDRFIHGAVVTIAIDTSIKTVFGSDKKQAHPAMLEQLAKDGLGTWACPAAERVLRVTNIIAAFTELLTHENQRLFWYSDNDQINDDGKKRNFKHTQQILDRVLYLTHKIDQIGVGKSFDEKSYLDDLLSVPDLAAGVVQDLLFQHETGADVPGGDEKIIVMRWIATPAKHLAKITIQVKRMENGEIGYGSVDMAVPQ